VSSQLVSMPRTMKSSSGALGIWVLGIGELLGVEKWAEKEVRGAHMGRNFRTLRVDSA
jgi:hypothetical protein